MSSTPHLWVCASHRTALAVFCATGVILGGRMIHAMDRQNPLDSRGVTYTASLPKTVFQRGEPVRLSLKLRNTSSGPLTIWLSGFWPNHQVRVTDETGVEPPLTAFGVSVLSAFAPGGDRDKNSPLVLRVGAVHQETTDLDLARLYRLGPGRYKVSVTYHDLQPPTPMLLTTAPLPFEIGP